MMSASDVQLVIRKPPVSAANFLSSSPVVPHTKVQGIDLCGDLQNVYIIRSDLKCYIKCYFSRGYNQGQGYQIYPLNPAFCWGDHYVKCSEGFVVIKGNSYFTVRDLSAPSDSSSVDQKPLATVVAQGEHYLHYNSAFYCIKGDTCVQVSDLSEPDSDTKTDTLHDSNKNGLYWFEYDSESCVITARDMGVLHQTSSSPNIEERHRFVHPDFLNFLPGGLAINFGCAEAKWCLLKAFNNSRNTAVSFSQKVPKKVGFNKKLFQAMEEKWTISSSVTMGTSYRPDFLIQSLVQQQFRLPKAYGGAGVETSQEDWSDEYDTTEKIAVSLDPGSSLYLWQFRLVFQGVASPVLSCHHVVVTDTHNPPTTLPLPPATA